MTGNRIFADARLEPLLTQFIARHVDGHSRFEVIHAAEHEIERAFRQAAGTDALHEVVVTVNRSNVIIVRLDNHVRIDAWKDG